MCLKNTKNNSNDTAESKPFGMSGRVKLVAPNLCNVCNFLSTATQMAKRGEAASIYTKCTRIAPLLSCCFLIRGLFQHILTNNERFAHMFAIIHDPRMG